MSVVERYFFTKMFTVCERLTVKSKPRNDSKMDSLRGGANQSEPRLFTGYGDAYRCSASHQFGYPENEAETELSPILSSA